MEYGFGGHYREGFTYCGTAEHAGIVGKGETCPRCGKGILTLVNESMQHYSHGMFHTVHSRYYLCEGCGAVYGPVSEDAVAPPDFLPFDYVDSVRHRGFEPFMLELSVTEDREARLALSMDGEPLGDMYLRRESVDAWIESLSRIRDEVKERDSE